MRSVFSGNAYTSNMPAADEPLTMEKLEQVAREISAVPPAPRFIESDMMTDRVEDWSRVRSPGRAERRRRQGHRQNIVSVDVPKSDAISLDGGRTYYLHPITAYKLRRQIDAANQEG